LLILLPVCFHDKIEQAMKISHLHSWILHQSDKEREYCASFAYIIIWCINDENVKNVIENFDFFK
jgi:hypothetical protein